MCKNHICTCQEALKKQLKIKEQLIEYLVDALNDPRFCEDHIFERDCPKKDLQCGDCLVKEFYKNLREEELQINSINTDKYNSV